MEGLNLEDLNFDEDSIQLFDEPLEDLDKSISDAKSSEEKDTTEDDSDSAKENNTDGDGQATADQEIVADQSKDTNQVQAGKKPTQNGDGSNSSSPQLNETEQLYSNLAAEFKAKGVLPELDIEKIKSLKDIEDAIQNQINNGLTERQKFIEDAQRSGAPVSEVSEKAETIDKLKRVTPEFLNDERNLQFRMTAIVQDFMQKGYSEERATSMAQRSVDSGTDIEDAQFALNDLIKAEEAALKGLIDGAKNQEQDSLNNIKRYISDTPEVIPGISLTNSQKDELYNQMTTSVSDDRDNAFMAAQKVDPVGSRIKLEALFYLTKGLTDFSVFGAKQETKITNDLENLIRGAKFTGSGSVDTNSVDKDSNFTLTDLKNFEIE
jgi:predicted nucleic acid-binding OB-fold protein